MEPMRILKHIRKSLLKGKYFNPTKQHTLPWDVLGKPFFRTVLGRRRKRLKGFVFFKPFQFFPEIKENSKIISKNLGLIIETKKMSLI